jgi:hypothetical protein
MTTASKVKERFLRGDRPVLTLFEGRLYHLSQWREFP